MPSRFAVYDVSLGGCYLIWMGESLSPVNALEQALCETGCITESIECCGDGDFDEAEDRYVYLTVYDLTLFREGASFEHLNIIGASLDDQVGEGCFRALLIGHQRPPSVTRGTTWIDAL